MMVHHFFFIYSLPSRYIIKSNCFTTTQPVDSGKPTGKIARAIYGNAINVNDGLPSNHDKTYFNETSCFYNDVIHSCGLST